MKSINLKKQHPDLPDSYGMKLEFIDGSKPIECEVASHGMMYALEYVYDAIHDEDNPSKQPKMLMTGAHRVETRNMEIKTLEAETIVICMDNVKTIKFDKRWDKIVTIRQELAAKGEL